ncbi:hypothetical protein DL769_004781 [Monosporascus sp. CRB-8-3]|nr:hypothetical protein DL769_004781 [Monosporascus sp. CRB-8-3]
MVEAIRFLGPEHCAVSIVEGNSPDGTAEVLAALQPALEKLVGVQTHFVLSNTIDPLSGSRFGRLAELRNMALQPMLNDPGRYVDATVIFLNDVSICAEDILELIHQRRFLGADMTCAFDWIWNDDGVSLFYDSYVARGINGDLFFEIPPDTVTYDLAQNLFWNEPKSRALFESHKPFQVFSCWNGAVAFSAKPLVEGKVTFREARASAGECHQAEPQLFCKDMWFQGYGKIAVVPSVNLEYSNEKGSKIKEQKGYTWQWTDRDPAAEDKITWQPPPDMVRCMPTFDNQSWRPWNETLT